jgi:hypothetical protein
MATTGKVVGPGGTSKSAKATGCYSTGPRGVAGSNTSTTTSKGYENGRMQGMRSSYRESGRANNSKA